MQGLRYANGPVNIGLLRLCWVLVAVLMVPGPSRAEVHGAHRHGVAQLLVVAQAAVINIELSTPGFNLLGFEHHPHTELQRSRLNSVQALLADGGSLFSFRHSDSHSRCSLLDYRLDFGDIANSQAYVQTKPGLDKHGAGRHSNITATYRFHCQQDEGVAELNVEVLRTFPGIDRLDVQWVIDGRQGAASLNKSRRNIRFK